jgi:hypothetical protein
MTRVARFSVAMLRMFSGFMVWGAHFGILYGFTALACARQFHEAGWLGLGVVPWVVIVATVAAVGTIVAVLRPVWRRRGRGPDAVTPAFLDWMTLAVGGLSLLAIGFEAIPVWLVPAC